MHSATLVLVAIGWAAAGPPNDELATQLRALDGRVLSAQESRGRQLARLLALDVRERRQAANERATRAWQEVSMRDDWERFRDTRLQALRKSLGHWPAVPRDLKVRVMRTLERDGYCIQNIIFESRPDVVVTANLYQPSRPAQSMPGILICHSHHNPKTEAELQDMGMTWARLGCLVLIMDQLGHGERRQHPFVDTRSYSKPFRLGRQDYYFRYNVGMQLHVIGDSLIGWMVWDLMRGVDLLLSRPGIDSKRIILLGAVAGGGDPAAVAAALDQRITAVAPFNFGGPQPETAYPLAFESAKLFNYAGSGSWESTRNVRRSAADGFMPWVIVGAVAPRRLIYAHEFAWDRDRDPVWARLETIYGLYGVRDHLAEAHGKGTLAGKPPDSSHCNNIGPLHRQAIYAALKQWLDIPVPVKEFAQQRLAEELICVTPELAQQVKPRAVHELAAKLGAERAARASGQLEQLAPSARRDHLRKEWTRLLGDVEPRADPKVTAVARQRVGDVALERLILEVEPGMVVPLVLLAPPRQPKERLAVVVALAQEGKQAFLANRSESLARLLRGGVAVCLPDVRGTGETRPEDDARGRSSSSTAISSSELMLGQTLLGSRLRDLRSVLRFLRLRADCDPDRIALWGDAFAAPNPPDVELAVPLDAAEMPVHAEPLGGMLALWGALYEHQVRCVYVRGGLVGFHSLLQSPFVYVPHDVIVPGALTAGDLCDVAAALAPRPLWFTGLVDGLDRRVDAGQMAKALEPTQAAYRAMKASDSLLVEADERDKESVARWFLAVLRNN
jgi:hypothetical protein